MVRSQLQIDGSSLQFGKIERVKASCAKPDHQLTLDGPAESLTVFDRGVDSSGFRSPLGTNVGLGTADFGRRAR
jgi:hypothetical protein